MKKIAFLLTVVILLGGMLSACSNATDTAETLSPSPSGQAPSASISSQPSPSPSPTEQPVADNSYLGTNPGNLINSGYVVAGDGYVYFRDPNSDNMWRMNADGSDVETIIEGSSPYHLNYLDGTLYYYSSAGKGTYAADPDGKNAYKMSEKNVLFNFLKDKIFIYESLVASNISTISKDGKTVTPIFEIEQVEKPQSLRGVAVGTDTIYFLRSDSSGVPSTLYAMQPDGKEVTELLSYTNGTMSKLVCYNGMLYYVLTVLNEGDGQRTVTLRQCALDGSKDKELITNLEGNYNIDGDTILYSTTTGFVRYSLKTGTEQEISLGTGLNMIDICDGRLYYVVNKGVHPNGVQRPAYLGRVLLDGTEQQVFDSEAKAWVSANEAKQLQYDPENPYKVEGSVGKINMETFRQDYAKWLIDKGVEVKLDELPTYYGEKIEFYMGKLGVVNMAPKDGVIIIAVRLDTPMVVYNDYFRAALECSGLGKKDADTVADFIPFAITGFKDTHKGANGITYVTGRNAMYVMLTLSVE